MFEKMLKHLEELDGKEFTFSFPVNKDDKGYYDKECPNSICLKKFKVFAEDWDKLNKNDSIYCPFCRQEKDTDSWWITEQINNAKEQAIEDIKYEIHEAVKQDAEMFNRKQQTGFISLQMKVGDMSKPVHFPLSALESMQQEITCDNCKKRYAVIGASYYCPFCGINAVPVILENSLQKIKAKVKNLDNVYNLLKETSLDNAEFVKASMLESSFSELVTTFQKLCESIYEKLPNAQLPLKRNVFQRIDDGSVLWKNAIGKDYSNWLTSNELNLLKIYFQKRHVLEHNQGVIDTDYLTKTNDTTYLLGQRLIIKSQDVIEFISLIEKLSVEILKLK